MPIKDVNEKHISNETIMNTPKKSNTVNERQQKYYQKNPNKKKESNRKYYEMNAEAIKEKKQKS